MQKEAKYPRYDIGDFLPSQGEDWFWGEGALSDGRSYHAEVYYQAGVTCVDIHMSSLEVEDYSEKELKELLIAEGVLTYNDDLYHQSGFEGENIKTSIEEDASGNSMWKITIIIGDEDGTYVKTFFKRNNYDFFDHLKKAPTTEDYLLALKDDNDTLYSCILVNNTDQPIDIVIEGPPVMNILHGFRTNAIIESIKAGKSDSLIHGPISPHSIKILKWRYYKWEFDFVNKKYLFLKTPCEEILTCFIMEKYFPAIENLLNIPFTDKQGFICQSKLIMKRKFVEKVVHLAKEL